MKYWSKDLKMAKIKEHKVHEFGSVDLIRKLKDSQVLSGDLLKVDRRRLSLRRTFGDQMPFELLEGDQSVETIFRVFGKYVVVAIKEMSPFIIERRYFVSDEKFDLVLQLSYVHDPDYTSYHNFLHPETFDQGAGI